MGGAFESDDGDDNFTWAMNCYDPSAEQWRALPKMSEARSGCKAVCIDGLVYVVGGVVDRDDSSSASASAECYDPHRQQWRKLPDMGIARAECVAACLDGLLCVVGGECEGIPLASAECYDASTGQWCMYR